MYKECTQNWRHYTLDMRLITECFASVKQQGLAGIDDFKNKISTNYSLGLNKFLDKLPSSTMRNLMWNSLLMIGKINFGISQRLSYPKSKSEAKKQNVHWRHVYGLLSRNAASSKRYKGDRWTTDRSELRE